jgi:predicted RNase H-like nuclease (RuvC/YqgF family)
MVDEPSQIESLERRIAELEAENEALRREADDLDRQVAELEGELEGLSLQAAEAEARLAEVDDLAVEVADLQGEVESLGKANAELEMELAASEASVSLDSGRASEFGREEERMYVASNTRQHFHRPDCEWARYIPDYKLIEFSSHAEAVAAGKKPCKTCRA